MQATVSLRLQRNVVGKIGSDHQAFRKTLNWDLNTGKNFVYSNTMIYIVICHLKGVS